MKTNQPIHLRYKRLLAGTTVAGMAAVMVATGVPATIYEAYAQPVTIEQPPQVPGFADIVEAVSPAVVSIRVRNGGDEDEGEETAQGPEFDIPGLEDLPEDHPMRRFFEDFGNPFGDRPFGDRGEGPRGGDPRFAISQGSGFFISADGYIVTNNHVIEGGSEYSIILDDGTEFKAELVGSDSRTDLAVLKVDAEERTFPYVEFGNDEDTRIGDWVVAVGNPFGLGGSVTAGIVSARGREIGAGPYDDFIQVDAAVNRGNSGGPTFNLSGEVIGVNTAIFSPSGGNVGIAFAIPSSLAENVVNELIEDGTVERGWIGVRIQPVTDEIAESLGLEEASGALVTAPTPGGPSAEAGVEAGDVVTAVNGEGVEDPGELARRIAALDPGAEVELTLWRNGAEELVTLELGTFPSEEELSSVLGEESEEEAQPSSDQELPDFGMTVVPAENGEGVVVSDLDPSGVAAERGFRVGDTIVSVQNQPVSSAEDISAAVEEATGNDRGAALFQIERDGDNRFVALPIEQG